MSDLTDLEICRKIAEIEGKSIDCDIGDCVSIHNGGDGKLYNPITDKALCFDLMVEYGVDFYSICVVGCTYEAVIFITSRNESIMARNKNPNKAICLAIIEANSNDK